MGPPTRQDGHRGDGGAGPSPDTVREPPKGTAVIGQIVAGRYQIESLVGSGGMAHVLSARHVELGHRVAIKVLDPAMGNNPEAKERFAREARAMANLSSKHTVRVHDVGTLPNGLPFMVMDLLVGKDLSQILNERGPLPFEDACTFIDQACEAVAEAHDIGLVHRDIKPQNLFLSIEKGGAGEERSVLRVLDFGIVRAVGRRMGAITLTKIGDVVGTLSYMAPEQIRDSSNVSARADIWALGACLYRLVCGKPPFIAKGDALLAEAILMKPPTPPAEHRPDIPSILSSVILRCLRKEPDERFQSARDLQRALEEARIMIAVAPHSAQMTTEPVQRVPPEIRLRDSQPKLSKNAAEANAMTMRAAGVEEAHRLVEVIAPVNATLASAKPYTPPAPKKIDTTVRMNEGGAGPDPHAVTLPKMGETVPLHPLSPPTPARVSRPTGPPPHVTLDPISPVQRSRPSSHVHPYVTTPPKRASARLVFLFIVVVVATIVIGTGLFVIFVLKP